MARTKISEFSATPGNNTDIDGINISEGCAPSGINDAIRELMAQLKDWQSGTSGDSFTIGSAGTMTYSAGTANGVLYLNGSKVLTAGSALTFDGSQLDVPAGSASAPSLSTTADANTGIYFPAADVVGISTGGTERARVDASGNLGLGVTPSAWSGLTAFELSAAGSQNFAMYGGGVLRNAFYNGTNWIYKASAASTLYEQTAGAHRWYTAPSGTAGNAISFTQAMTLAANSELNIDSGTGGGRLTFSPGATYNQILSTTTSFGAYNILRYRGTQHQWLDSAGTQAMTLDASGNLGLGVTSPVGLGSGIATLDIGGTNGGGLRFRRSGNSAFLFADGSGVDLGTNDSLYLRFITAATERARIDSGGNFRVRNPTGGNTSNGFLVEEDGSNVTRVSIGGANSSSATGLSIYSTTAGVFRFFVSYSGQINATSTSITAISDQSLKENIRDLDTGLSEVMALKPRRFDWKEETQLEQKNVAGFIAQEVAQVLPDLVYDYQYNETETKKSLKMGDILPTLVKAIQEQQQLITALTARVAALEAK